MAGVALGKCACSLFAGVCQRTYISTHILHCSFLNVSRIGRKSKILLSKSRVTFSACNYSFWYCFFFTQISRKYNYTQPERIAIQQEHLLLCFWFFLIGCCLVLFGFKQNTFPFRILNRINVSKIITQSYIHNRMQIELWEELFSNACLYFYSCSVHFLHVGIRVCNLR